MVGVRHVIDVTLVSASGLPDAGQLARAQQQVPDKRFVKYSFPGGHVLDKATHTQQDRTGRGCTKLKTATAVVDNEAGVCCAVVWCVLSTPHVVHLSLTLAAIACRCAQQDLLTRLCLWLLLLPLLLGAPAAVCVCWPFSRG